MDIARVRAHHREVTAAARYDRLTARLAELDSIRTVLGAAAERLTDGWIQDDWSGAGGVCLVAAIRAGSAGSTGQLQARAIDACWHARVGDRPGTAYGLAHVPPPAVRLARVRDLTRWNDRPGRGVAEVVHLLADARALVGDEMARLRQQLGLAGPADVEVDRPGALTP